MNRIVARGELLKLEFAVFIYFRARRPWLRRIRCLQNHLDSRWKGGICGKRDLAIQLAGLGMKRDAVHVFLRDRYRSGRGGGGHSIPFRCAQNISAGCDMGKYETSVRLNLRRRSRDQRSRASLRSQPGDRGLAGLRDASCDAMRGNRHQANILVCLFARAGDGYRIGGRWRRGAWIPGGYSAAFIRGQKVSARAKTFELVVARRSGGRRCERNIFLLPSLINRLQRQHRSSRHPGAGRINYFAGDAGGGLQRERDIVHLLSLHKRET